MAPDDQNADEEVGSLALSCVQVDEPMLRVRAARWTRTLRRSGLAVPLWLVHDVGLLAVIDPAHVSIARRTLTDAPGPGAADAGALDAWADTLRELAEAEVLRGLRRQRVSDTLLCAILLRTLAPVVGDRTRAAGRWTGAPPLAPSAYAGLEAEGRDALVRWLQQSDRTADRELLSALARERSRLLLAVEQLDMDTVRLLAMFGALGEDGALVDLIDALDRVDVGDIVDLSLDLLPSVLETGRVAGAQTFGVDGYAGVERQGHLDSLVMSELAFDADLFARRHAEGEVLYYAREKQRDEERRLHYVMIDATAAMRGQRAVFARGLALTLSKKLALQGEEVRMRFFDSHLYDAMRVPAGRTGGTHVAHLLTFRGERGRHYGKVFGMVADELTRLARHERRNPVLYVLTHAECHVPREVLERLRGAGTLYGVFILPSMGELELDHPELFHTVQVVDADALRERGTRARRALSIVDDATGERPR